MLSSILKNFYEHKHEEQHGEHICSLFESEDHWVETTSNFFAEGILKNERAVFFGHTHTEEQFERAIQTKIPDVQRYKQSGQLKYLPVAEVYPNGKLNSERTVSVLKKLTEEAIAKGYSKLRVSGEVSGGANSEGLSEALFEYESQIVDFFKTHPCIGLCQYDTNQFDPSCLLAVLTTHPKAVIAGIPVENFYYMPSKQFLSKDKHTVTFKQWTRNLLERKFMEQNLNERTTELQKVNVKLQDEVQERKKVQIEKEMAEELSRAKTNFLAVISHEIRTPLNGIVSMSKFLKETALTLEQQELVDAVDISGEHLITVLNDVLDFSKIETRKLQLECLPFSIRSCVSGAINIFRQPNNDCSVEVTSVFEPSDLQDWYLGDITRIRQILVNLVSNAVKFTPPNGQVCVLVSALNVDDKLVNLRFAVKDTGIGIPPEKYDIIFRPFSQVESATTRKYGGTGLGLAICSKLVEMMQGKIWFESQVNKGSTFYFTISSSVSDHSAASEHAFKTSKRIEEFKGEQLSILIAEDNIINQKVIERMLGKLSFTSTRLVCNGKEAVDTIKAFDFDLILMDLQMPELNGLDATVQINAMDWTIRTKPMIVAMTASVLVEDKLMCTKAGMDAHLSKPIRMEALMDVLDNARAKLSEIAPSPTKKQKPSRVLKPPNK